MDRTAGWMAAWWLVLLTSVGLSEEAAQVEGVCPCCCEELTPRGSAPGIFNCAGSCACCEDLRAYRSNILGRLWVRGEYLAWGMKGQYFPTLVTSSPAGTPSENTGVPGLSGTANVAGDEELLDGMRSGGRLSGGFWWCPEQYGGIEGSFFEVDSDSHQGYAANSSVGLARPYRDVTTGQWAAMLITCPGLQDGAINVFTDTQFSGGEALLRQVVHFGRSYRLDMVAGYRHAHLGDRLLVTHWSAPDATSTITDLYDLLQAENDFHGGQAGLIAELRRDNVSLRLLAKVGLGGTASKMDIDGATTVTTELANGSEVSDTYAGGLLALPSNMGHYRNSGFSTFEELGLNLQLQLTCTARVFFGYNFLYWSRVARVSDQLDLGVNPTQMRSGTLVGESRPTFNLKTTSFWAQGLIAGLEYQF